MAGSSLARNVGNDHDWHDRPSFLGSHRALAVCTRELGRLVDGVANGVVGLQADAAAEKPLVRMSPTRYIVQLGPVALTIAWLRRTLGSVADGELLVAVWRGTVAPRWQNSPERTGTLVSTTATVLWEDVLSVEANDEESWRWQPSPSGDGYTSAALAERCVERLRAAYAENAPEE